MSLTQDVATIDVFGARKDVSILLLPETPRLGDYVLVHAGFAIQSITAAAVESGEVMHEFSIAQSILDIAAEQCSERNCETVLSIRVRLGKETGVVPESLRSAFDELKGNTVAKNASLFIDLANGGEMEIAEIEFK